MMWSSPGCGSISWNVATSGYLRSMAMSGQSIGLFTWKWTISGAKSSITVTISRIIG